jgi:hypothetical protein
MMVIVVMTTMMMIAMIIIINNNNMIIMIIKSIMMYWNTSSCTHDDLHACISCAVSANIYLFTQIYNTDVHTQMYTPYMHNTKT